MATIPTVPSEKDTTKVSLMQSIIDALAELNAETGSSSFLKNGSFEDIESGEPLLWVISDLAGGSHAISDVTESGGEAHHGQRSLQTTETGLGGYVEALSDIFLPVGEDNTVVLEGFARRDTASIKIRAQVLYYNASKSLISTDTVYQDTGTGTTYAQVGGTSDAPVNALFYKIKLIGGEAGGAISGNVFFDGFAANILNRPPELEPFVFDAAGSTTYTVPDGVKAVHITVAGAGAGGGGSVVIGAAAGGGGSGFIEGITVEVTPRDVLVVSVGAGGAGGSGTNDGSDGVRTWVGPPSSDFDNRWVSGSGGSGGKSGNNGGAGGAGWNAGDNDSNPVGGDGADHAFGTPGAGGADGAPGDDATGNCAGGGGSGAAGPNAGGDGADGYIIVTPQLR